MIFLIVFGLIAIIVISLNMKDSANLKEIEDYLKAQKCTNIVYSKGLYKGLCDNKIIQISNGFSIDLEKDKTIFELKEIRSLDEETLKIVLNNSYEIEFKEEKNKKEFYESLKEKINK